MNLSDTIAAISTPVFSGAIGVIRVSGPETLSICTNLIRKNNQPISKTFILSNIRKALYCDLVYENKPLDHILFTFFHSPHTYTGEDMAEFSLHGNPILLRKALEILFKNGARPAEKGEFTKRAYLSGKLDISGTEAIGRLIGARSQLELELAQKNVFGEIHRLESRLRSDLIGLKAECEAEIDFSTEDLTFETFEERKERVRKIVNLCAKVLSGSKRADQLIQKTKIVIFGEPNTGKSSLLNLLVGKDRAIVSAIPGTTRDFLSEEIILSGLPVQLVDTAGIRETQDEIEKMGIERSEKEFDSANVKIVVLDSSLPMQMDLKANRHLLDLKNSIVVLNKSDILDKSWTTEALESQFGDRISDFVFCSCKNRTGIEELLTKIHSKIQNSESFSGEMVLLEDRNKYLIEKIEMAMQNALNLMEENAPAEIYVKEIDLALSLIGKINGRVETEEVLGRIFSSFCVGK